MNDFRLRCVVLEDEVEIRQWLIKKLEHFPVIELVGEAAHVDEAFRLISLKKPDIAFMDIQLLGGDAFVLLSRLRAHGLPIPYIVMATGYSEHAMTALNDYRSYIVQYLVKPFAENWRAKFRKAIDALIAAKMNELNIAKEVSPETPDTDLESNSYIFIQNKGNLLRLDFDHIVYLEAGGGGESIVVMNGVTHQVALTLNKFIALLPSHFIRISRSNIVNMDCVSTINRGERTIEIKLQKNHKTLGVSETYFNNFLHHLPLVKS